MEILQTERMIVRRLSKDDAEQFHELFSDPIAMRFYPSTKDRKETEQWIGWNLDNYERFGFGHWALIDKRKYTLIGICGLAIQIVDGIPEVEIDYHVRRELWGRGYATEAARACRDHAFESLDKTRLIAWMHPGNLSFRRVAEKIGMQIEKHTTNRQGTSAIVYAMSYDEWDSQKNTESASEHS